MERDSYKTVVCFRRFKTDRKEVIAIFPGQQGDSSCLTCGSYMHVGQHGACDPRMLMRITVPADVSEDDTAQLFRELESIGYNLRVVVRMNHHYWQDKRRLEAK